MDFAGDLSTCPGFKSQLSAPDEEAPRKLRVVLVDVASGKFFTRVEPCQNLDYGRRSAFSSLPFYYHETRHCDKETCDSYRNPVRANNLKI